MNEHHEQRELEALRAAWRRLDAPRDLGERVDSDRETRACVDWVARAWDALEPPPASAGLSSTGPSLRRQLASRVLPFAAAACTLLWVETRRPQSAVEPARDAARDPGGLQLAQAEPIRPVILANGSVETRYGNVRFILLPESETEPSSPTPSSPTDGPGTDPASGMDRTTEPSTETKR